MLVEIVKKQVEGLRMEKRWMTCFSDKFRNPWDNNRPSGPSGGGDGDEIDELLNMARNFQRRMGNNFRQNFGRAPESGGGRSPYQFIKIAAGVVAVLWLSTGFYTIQPDEEGVVMTLGKYSRTSYPGLSYKLPDPIESITKVSVTRVNKEEVGFRSAGKRITTRAELIENTVFSESQMLTTDENIVDINFEVQWQISSAKDYLFNVRDLMGENTVKTVAESAMREVIGLTKVSDVLAEERSKIESMAKISMQAMLDNYQMGVRVMRVQLLRVDPPQEVIDAYRDVQNAKQDKEREINQAYAYRNDIIPRARGEAEKILQEAAAYKYKVEAEATGEANRFSHIYDEYRSAKEVTRKRMYIEALEETLMNVDKILIEKSASNQLLPHLSVNDFKTKKEQ
jgi:membrane protease subunit HflK